MPFDPEEFRRALEDGCYDDPRIATFFYYPQLLKIYEEVREWLENKQELTDNEQRILELIHAYESRMRKP